MKRLLALLAAALTLASMSGVVLASPESKAAGVTTKLKPHAEGVLFPGTISAVQKQDSVTINIEGSGQSGVTSSYHFEIDLQTKTYKAKQRSILEIPATSRAGQTTVTPLGVPQTWTAEVILTTEDPPQADLATTTNYMVWNVDGTQVTRLSSPSYTNCWANPLTLLYTTWTTTRCAQTNSATTQEIAGEYINWDWIFDTLSTKVKHWSKIQGLATSNGTFSYWTSYDHSGESWAILQIDLFVNGIQLG